MRMIQPQLHPCNTHHPGNALKVDVDLDASRQAGVDADYSARFAHSIVRRLTEGLHDLPDGVAIRLSQARHQALQHKAR